VRSSYSNLHVGHSRPTLVECGDLSPRTNVVGQMKGM
jgi:hypothetical protein